MERSCRNSNFELLRIIAMLLIVSYHLVSNGLLLPNGIKTFEVWENGIIYNKIFASFLYCGGGLGNILFFMISGYFLINKKTRNVKNLVLETIFWSVTCCILYVVLSIINTEPLTVYGGYKIKLLAFLLTPITSGVNWFVTTYVLLLLVLPILNAFLLKLEKYQFLLLLLLLNVLGIGVDFVTGSPFYDLYRGLLYYSCGAYYKLFINRKRFKSFLILPCYVFATICAFFFLYFSYLRSPISIVLNFFIRVLFTPLLGFLIFDFFANIKIENKSINYIASYSLSVYLIHGSILQCYIWDCVFKIPVLYNSKSFIFVSIIDTLLVYFSCLLLNLIRTNGIFPIFRKLATSWSLVKHQEKKT